MRDPQKIQGPADGRLRHSELEGYAPVSRIGEVVVTAAVDMYEHGALPDLITAHDVDPGHVDQADKTVYEYKPHAFEWASALPGQVALSRRGRNTATRLNAQTEAMQPVIVSCACLGEAQMKDWYFAGIVRSKSVKKFDDGQGPSEDEAFTLTINAQATMINNSNETIYPGDMIEWTFFNSLNSESKSGPRSALDLVANGQTRGNTYPRKIAVKVASVGSDRLFGRALTYAKPLDQFDLLIRGC